VNVHDLDALPADEDLATSGRRLSTGETEVAGQHRGAGARGSLEEGSAIEHGWLLMSG
jgi:hypothetical protein